MGLPRAVRQVYFIEKVGDHPLLGLLGARAERDAKSVRSEASSVEAWQAEARRLELQGKTEQAEAIRATVARTQKVPWLVIDAAGHDELAAKALAPNSVFTKAKHSLFEWSCFHDQEALANRLVGVGFVAAVRYPSEQEAARRRQLAPFAGKHFKDVLDQTERYGVDYRTPMGTTPLMMAAAAGNVPLVDALLTRGARRDLVDPFGRAAMHHALRSAYRDERLAGQSLGAVWERVAVPAIDLLIDGRLVRLAPHQAEYFVFAAMSVLLPDCYDIVGRRRALSAEMLSRRFGQLSEAVFPSWRQRREYLNAVLARAEAQSTYQPARRLWLRERRGEYLPNPALAVRVVDEHGEETWRPLVMHLGVDLLERHVPRRTPQRQSRAG